MLFAAHKNCQKVFNFVTFNLIACKAKALALDLFVLELKVILYNDYSKSKPRDNTGNMKSG